MNPKNNLSLLSEKNSLIMKTCSVCRIRYAFFALTAVLLAACTRENEFTPEEKETQMTHVSDELLQFTLQFKDRNSKELDAVLKNIRKNEFVKDVEKKSDHVKVTYSDGLEIYYPFIVPSAFDGRENSPEAPDTQAEASPSTRAGSSYNGGCVILDYFSDDASRTTQTGLLKQVARIAYDEFGYGVSAESSYHGKEMVTAANIERALANSGNKVVVIATHGFDNTVITSESIPVADLASLSFEEREEYKGKQRLVSIGEKNAAGQYIYNKGWFPKDYAGIWNCDFAYFTGCGVFTPDVCKALEQKGTKSLIVGWDGKNDIAEALLCILFDCFAQGMSFIDFYNRPGSHSDVTFGSNIVYAGGDPTFKPSSKTYEESGLYNDSCKLSKPSDFCHKTYYSYTTTALLDDNLQKNGNFILRFSDLCSATQSQLSSNFNLTGNAFDELASSRQWDIHTHRDGKLAFPGVTRITLAYQFKRHDTDVEILVDQRYAIRSHNFGVNSAEETVPDIKVATLVASNGSSDMVYGCQVTVFPSDLIEQGFQIWEKDNPSQVQVIQGTPHEKNPQVFQAAASGLTAGRKYQAKAFVKYRTGDVFYGNVFEFTASGGTNTNPAVGVPEAVDLGLSVKWSSFNLGASKPEEYGDYYAWGETEPYYSSLDPLTWKDGKKAGYTLSSYKWCMGGYNTLTKYCWDSKYGYNGYMDDKKILDPQDDAAYLNLGGNWRMPTHAEWQELSQNCTWIWTEWNGVSGLLLTSNVAGYTDRHVFFPAAGCWAYTSFHAAGSSGYYWSSSLYSEGPFSVDDSFHAWDVVLYSSGISSEGTSNRDNGKSIRPVYAE